MYGSRGVELSRSSGQKSATFLPTLAQDQRLSWRALEIVTVLGLLVVSLVVRLHQLDGPRSGFPDLFDEGIRYQQLFLMSNGFRPFRDIYAAQGLLLLDVLYPFYALFGGTLGAARLGVGLLSVLGLLGAWWSARQIGGIVGGLVTLFLLSTSPAYLEGSRLALAEVPSLVPCLWAIGCALRWFRNGSSVWLYSAVALATIGVLIKPMAISVAVPIALLLVLRPGLRPRHVLTAAGVALGITTIVVLIMGPAEVYQQIVQYRLGARQGGGWDLRRNFKDVLTQPFREQPGLFVLAGAGGLLLVGVSRRAGLALASWLVATILLLLVYYPLHPKHLVYIQPPLALVGGAGLGMAAWLAWKEGPAGRSARLTSIGLAALIAGWPMGVFAGGLQSFRDPEEDDADLHVFDRDAAESIAALTGPREFILTDHPYIAALARRMVPPNLVDPSRGRTRAGALSDREVIDSATAYDTRLVFVWADRLRRLPGVPPWLDSSYVLSQAFGNRSVKNARGAKDRSIYLRRDSDLAGARSRLEGALDVRETADFDAKLRLLGARVSTLEVDHRDQFTLTLGWLSLAPMSSDYHLSIELFGPDREAWHEQEHDLEGSLQGSSTWEPGRWLFRTFSLQLDAGAPAGSYTVEISLINPKGGEVLKPAIGQGATTFRLRDPKADRLTVGTVRVD